MAAVEEQQGGPSSPRRRKHAGKSKAQAANDWPRSSELRSRASPRSKRHGDIDMDIVESPDDTDDAQPSLPRKQRRRRRSHLPSSTPSDTASDAASDTTAPARSTAKSTRRSPDGKGRSRSMRAPNAPVSRRESAPTRRRPTCIIEVEDDDEDDNGAAPSGPSRPVSRQTISRHDTSPRSAHRYRSTPESRRSPRTSVSDSEDDTDATSDSADEQVIQPRGDKPLPPAPMAPPPPSAARPASARNSVHERLSRRPEMVYEEEGDGASRYAPSVARHRSLSRAPSTRRDHYRRPTDIIVSGPPSLDETRSRSRSKSARPSRRHYESDVYVPSRPASSFKRPHASSSYSLSSSKHSTFFADLAATPTPVRPPRLENLVERVTTCVRCRNDRTPVSKTVKFKCRHRMCHSCLVKLFTASLTDAQHLPPQCCDTDIPFEHVDFLFDAGFKRDWALKYREHASRKRLACPSRRCGELIKPEDMRREGGRWHARCSRCRTKVCGSCGGVWHREPECPGGEEAIQEPRRRCRRCKAAVEIRDGRNHIICRCGAEFCLLCGDKWKTCACPWYNEDPSGAGAALSRAHSFDSRPGSPHDFRSDFGPNLGATARQRPSSYEEDVHLRRLYEQRDEHLARKMHSLDAFGHHGSHADFDHRNRRDYELHEDVPGPRDRRRRAEPRSYGASFGEDDYHRRAATVVAPSPPQAHLPPAPPPPRSAFEPPLSRPAFDRSEPGFDYVSAAQRLRGMRYASPERFDDYPAESYPPERRRDRSPSQWHPFTPERRPRSRDRRHTFPSESRPTSPETWQQLPTRYPSPERPMPAPEERRRVHSAERLRAPSSDRRRATSLERRLADRFKAESRQSPVAPTSPVAAVGPAGPFGPAGTLGPLSPTRAPPPVTRAATHIGVGMPMAPVPPPAVHGPVPVVTHLRRHHTMDEDVYAPGGMHGGAIPPDDWFGAPPAPHPHPHPHAHPLVHPHSHPPPGMGMMHPMHHDMLDVNAINAGSPRAPNVKRRPPHAHREHSKLEEPKSSVLAGLAGVGRGMHRVSEWVHYVEPGLPEGEQTPTVVQ